MIKKPTILIVLLALLIPICLTWTTHYFKLLIKEKFLEAAEIGLGRGISLSEFDISFLGGIIFLRGIRVEDCRYIKYRNSASADEIILDVDLPATLLKRNLVFQEIYLKNFTFDFNNKKKPSQSLSELQVPKKTLPPSQEITSGYKDSKAKISPPKPIKNFDTLYVKRILIENSKFLFQDCSVTPPPNIIKITDINGKIEELSLASDGILKGYIYLKGQLNSGYEGRLRLDGSFTKGERDIDFDFNLILDNVNLTRFSPYYADTSFTILKEAKLDLKSNAKCLKNHINAKQNARIYDIKLYEIKPSSEDKLFGLPAKTVIEFFKDLKGDVKFDFNIVGTIDDPKFEFGPVIQQVLIKALHDKIVAKLQELPREVIKISEKAIREDFGKIDEIDIPDEDKIEEMIKEVGKGLKKIIRIKP